MSQAGELNVVQNHPNIPTLFSTNSGNAIPLANELEILGIDGITTTGAGNTITIGFAGGASAIETISGNDGIPVGPNPITADLNLLGDNISGINITGDPGTFTLTVFGLASSTTQVGTTAFATNAETALQTLNSVALTPSNITSFFSTNPLPASQGGTGLSTQAPNQLIVTFTSNAFLPLGEANNGQIPIGSLAAPPVLANLSTANGINVLNGPGSITISNLRDVGRYVVAPVVGRAGYTSIQTAINQAVTDGANATTPATIWIMSGTYTENLILAPFVSLASKAAVTVNIIGNASFTSANDGDTISFNRVTFTTPIGGGDALTVLGTNICTLFIETCLLTGNTGNCLTVNNTNASIEIFDSILQASSGFKVFNVISSSSIAILSSDTSSVDTPSTVGGPGNIIFIGCFLQDAIVFTDSALAIIKACIFISIGTIENITLGPGNICLLFDTTIGSNATSGFWVTGTGALLYAAVTSLVFFSAQQIDPAVNVINQPLSNSNLSFDGGLTSIVNDGQLIIGSSTSHPQISTLTAGTGINISNGPGTITISSTAVSAYTNVNNAASPYTILPTDQYISVDTSGGPVTLQFPNAPIANTTWIVKDRTGNAATNNISITTVGGIITIDGQTTYTMVSNYSAIQLLANATPTYEVF